MYKPTLTQTTQKVTEQGESRITEVRLALDEEISVNLFFPDVSSTYVLSFNSERYMPGQIRATDKIELLDKIRALQEVLSKVVDFVQEN